MIPVDWFWRTVALALLLVFIGSVFGEGAAVAFLIGWFGWWLVLKALEALGMRREEELERHGR